MCFISRLPRAQEVYDYASRTLRKMQEKFPSGTTDKGLCCACQAAGCASQALARAAREQRNSRDDITVLLVRVLRTAWQGLCGRWQCMRSKGAPQPISHPHASAAAFVSQSTCACTGFLHQLCMPLSVAWGLTKMGLLFYIHLSVRHFNSSMTSMSATCCVMLLAGQPQDTLHVRQCAGAALHAQQLAAAQSACAAAAHGRFARQQQR